MNNLSYIHYVNLTLGNGNYEMVELLRIPGSEATSATVVGNTLYYVSYGGTIKRYDLVADKALLPWRKNAANQGDIFLFRYGNRIAYHSLTGNIGIINTNPYREEVIIDKRNANIRFADNDSLFYSYTINGQAFLYEYSTIGHKLITNRNPLTFFPYKNGYIYDYLNEVHFYDGVKDTVIYSFNLAYVNYIGAMFPIAKNTIRIWHHTRPGFDTKVIDYNLKTKKSKEVTSPYYPYAIAYLH